MTTEQFTVKVLEDIDTGITRCMDDLFLYSRYKLSSEEQRYKFDSDIIIYFGQTKAYTGDLIELILQKGISHYRQEELEEMSPKQVSEYYEKVGLTKADYDKLNLEKGFRIVGIK